MVDLLVAWFEENQRRLPWRVTYDPYQVWISEVMLQQTQVETALPYYERFISRFPTIEALASASEEEVLTLWAGLGYYRRPKNLMAAAREIMRKHRGVVPSDYDALIGLPGIGRYIAGAILSIAFNKAFPVVDGNVRRVLCRLYGWTEENPGTMWDAADRLVQSAEPRLVNQALMELGATVCSFKSPRCLLCPIQSQCAAYRAGMQEAIPQPKKRPAVVHVHLFAVMHRRGNRYLMKSADGMWEFPLFTELPPGSFKKIGDCRHTITHHRIDVSVHAGKVNATGYVWTDPNAVPISSLTRKILRTGVDALD